MDDDEFTLIGNTASGDRVTATAALEHLEAATKRFLEEYRLAAIVPTPTEDDDLRGHIESNECDGLTLTIWVDPFADDVVVIDTKTGEEVAENYEDLLHLVREGMREQSIVTEEDALAAIRRIVTESAYVEAEARRRLWADDYGRKVGTLYDALKVTPPANYPAEVFAAAIDLYHRVWSLHAQGVTEQLVAKVAGEYLD